jgi:hypothetical protein
MSLFRNTNKSCTSVIPSKSIQEEPDYDFEYLNPSLA